MKEQKVRKLHPTQVAVLKALQTRPIKGLTMQEICDAVGVTNWKGEPSSTIRGCVSKMQARGYIKSKIKPVTIVPYTYIITASGRKVLVGQPIA